MEQLLADAKDRLSQFSPVAAWTTASGLLVWPRPKTAAKKSSVIELSYEVTACALPVGGGQADRFIPHGLRLNRNARVASVLADQTRRLHDALSHREADLRDLKNQTGLASPEAQRKMIGCPPSAGGG